MSDEEDGEMSAEAFYATVIPSAWIGMLDLCLRERLVPARGGGNVVALFLEDELQEVEDVLLVVDHQDLLLHFDRPTSCAAPRPT